MRDEDAHGSRLPPAPVDPNMVWTRTAPQNDTMTIQPPRSPSADLLQALVAHASEALFCIAFDPAPAEADRSVGVFERCLTLGTLELANPAALKWLGPNAHVGCRMAEVCGSAAGDDHARHLEELLGSESLGAVQRVAEDGKLVRILCRVATNQSGESERHAQRLQTAGLLVGGLAHDYHNLLTVVLGSAEIALQQAGHSDPTPHLEEIHAAARSAAALGQQLAALAHEHPARLQPVDIAPLLRRSIALLRRLLDPSAELHIDIEPSLPSVHADPGQFEQALIGMVLSIRDALPKGGCIRVVVDEDAEQNIVQICVYGEHGDALEVQPGAPGLELARNLLELAGGSLSVEQLDDGPHICAHLNLAGGRPQSLTPASPAANGSATRTRMLLVDDHDVLRHFMARMLRSYGYEVISVANADEALQLPAAERAGIELILADVLMPGISGPEFVSRWRADGSETPAVFTSGASGSHQELERWLGNACTLVEKPFRNEDLLAALQAALAN